MKIIHTLVWFIVFVVLVQIFVPIERQDFYNLKNDKALWVKEKIFGSHEDYDTIFLGTSHTLCAIDPKLVRPEAALNDKALNLAICWGGRNLYYIFAGDLLANHKVKNLVVEVCSYKPKHVFHPAFRFYCNTKDVFDGPPLSVKLFSLSHKKMFTTRLSDICAALLKPPVVYLRAKLEARSPYKNAYDSSLLGFAPGDLSPDKAKEIKEAFKQDPAQVAKAKDQTSLFGPPYSDWFYYLHKISNLAKENGTHLYILYLPSRNYPIPTDGFVRELSLIGALIIPDLEKIYRYDLWFDNGHLNSRGAVVLSEDLESRIVN